MLVDVLPVPPFWLAIEIIIIVSTYPKAYAGFFSKFLQCYALIRVTIPFVKIKRENCNTIEPVYLPFCAVREFTYTLFHISDVTKGRRMTKWRVVFRKRRCT